MLLELECAKNDGGLKGLKILDEPAYLKPVVTKLPDLRLAREMAKTRI